MRVPSPFDGVKLVVWDLDDTLWHGTLDDGDTPVPTELHRWFEPLARAGVMNAVCSNNDPGRAWAELDRLGVRGWIVFPRISWQPKHELLAGLLADVRLRGEDVLYIDDLARHRRLASDRLGMRSADPADLPRFEREPDRSMLSDRLERYRALERRTTAAGSTSGGREFLERSGVTVALTTVDGHQDRIAELSQRANQLNFSGSRLSPAEVLALAADPAIDSRAVWVRDAYGDYGLSGFYARRAGGPLLHLFFSCRVLHLGVDAHVHAALGRPELLHRSDRVSEDRWRDLAADAVWVADSAAPLPTPAARPGTFWAGGCDLQILSGLLAGGDEHDVWLLPGEQGGAQVYARSSVLALDADYAHLPVLDAIPWTHGAVRPEADGSWTTLVLSPWVDCSCLTYVHRPTGARFPSFVALDGSSTDWDWEHWWGDNPGQDAFLADCEPAAPLTGDEIANALVRLAERIGPRRRLLVLTAPEVGNGREYAWGDTQLARHRDVNRALEAAASRASNLALIDVRDVVTELNDLHGPDDPMMFHYRRDRYRLLAELVSERLRRTDRAAAG